MFSIIRVHCVHLQIVKRKETLCGSSRSQMFFTKGILKNSAIFTREYLRWRLFLITFIKNRLQYRCFPVNITKFFRKSIFYIKHFRWLFLSKKDINFWFKPPCKSKSYFQKQHFRGDLGKGVRKICSKFIGENPCRSAISIKLLCTLTWVFSCKFPACFQNTFS